MDVRPVEATRERLIEYLNLFRACFPQATTFTRDYLEWLYTLNPVGRVVGFDAWEGEELAAHYVCIPVSAEINGRKSRVLLSLNTATHPNFQGKGLFTRLADATYGHAADQGFSGVYGVANANSTHGFIKKLGFELVSPLDAKVGIGSLGEDEAAPDATSFRRVWEPNSLAWRTSNPSRRYRLARIAPARMAAFANTGKPGLVAWDEVVVGIDHKLQTGNVPLAARLHLGLRPAGVKRRGLWMDVPARFRTSPLNLIYRPLGDSTSGLDRRSIWLGQLDFDAF